jgi:Uma2 family endonuclease
MMGTRASAIPFDRFLELAEGRHVELINGTIVEKPMVQLDHDHCSHWLDRVLGTYVEERRLGDVLGSRTMVKAGDIDGRMPDLLFVRQERLDICRQKGVFGAPDLVIEILSPNDWPSHLRDLREDYGRIGVRELLFIDLARQTLLFLRRRGEIYEETVASSGLVIFESIDGLTLQAEWILREPRPGVRATLNALLP